jgi:NTE family protein
VDAARLAEPLLAVEGAPAPPAGPAPDFARLTALIAEAQSGARNPAEVRRELGAFALEAQTPPEAAYVSLIAQSIGAPLPDAWPERAFACTAIDVEDGGFQLWDGSAGVELLPAVSASCAVPGVFPPVTLGGRRYMDGGMRSFTNADLAVGHDLVVLVAVQPPGAPAVNAQQLADEVESLKSGGATVVTILPDEAAGAAFGPNLMDFGRSAAVARAGLAQGAAQAAVLKSVWG